MRDTLHPQDRPSCPLSGFLPEARAGARRAHSVGAETAWLLGHLPQRGSPRRCLRDVLERELSGLLWSNRLRRRCVFRRRRRSCLLCCGERGGTPLGSRIVPQTCARPALGISTFPSHGLPGVLWRPAAILTEHDALHPRPRCCVCGVFLHLLTHRADPEHGGKGRPPRAAENPRVTRFPQNLATDRLPRTRGPCPPQTRAESVCGSCVCVSCAVFLQGNTLASPRRSQKPLCVGTGPPERPVAVGCALLGHTHVPVLWGLGEQGYRQVGVFGAPALASRGGR
ncbi:uncharacterized protein LOC118352667 [Canis lupus dingo]|uniref:uncharacterized protein LOC118352667 n=1 Tax=Canis lupus dingo TaxID=286419 RepID=UPI0020C1F715|nr:uncharacterized protein LOC118352667 [Canis lupus dingo]